ncbi:thiamine diphosphokinase [Bacillus massiliglaciei]|uniref:thiamine diphosphokinase n=1 Tax=Bacillus massiliglaciei TaxID=1816693 RepID=UPI000AB821A8|nr:thiamine diphosphokinase [Bacillus massiliglaciei]
MIIGIMAGGPPELYPSLNEYKKKADLWIGVDRGVIELVKSGISPKAAFGDFDSITDTELTVITEMIGDIHIYPPEKDETDLELALNWSIGLKPEEIFILGATGGRIDHFLGNLQLLQRRDILELNRQLKIYIADRQNLYTIKTPGTYTFEKEEYLPYFSLLPVTNIVKGITLRGFKYPLEKADVERGSTLTVSNQLISDRGNVSFSEGILMVIRSSD